MLRKMLGIFTAVAAALVVVGVAWASGDVSSSTSLPEPTLSAAAESSTSASISSSTSTDDNTSTTLDDRGSTSTSLAGSTSTTIDDSTSTTIDDNGGSTSTTIDDNGGSTSTTIDDSTSTTFDDSDLPVPDGTYVYQVASAGTVTIRVTNGAMSLDSVNASLGWSFEVEKNRSDDVEVDFELGDAEASIRVRADHGELKVEIESKTS